MSEQTYEPVRFVYAGRRLDDKGKTFYELLPVGDGALGESRWYSKRPTASVGGTVVMDQAVGTTSIQFTSLRWTPDQFEVPPETVQAWRAKDLDAEQRAVNKSLLTKAAKVEPLDSLLGPLRELVPRLSRSERRALAVKILEVLS